MTMNQLPPQLSSRHQQHSSSSYNDTLHKRICPRWLRVAPSTTTIRTEQKDNTSTNDGCDHTHTLLNGLPTKHINTNNYTKDAAISIASGQTSNEGRCDSTSKASSMGKQLAPQMILPITPTADTRTTRSSRSSNTGNNDKNKDNNGHNDSSVVQNELLALRLTTFWITMPLIFLYVIVTSSPQYRTLHTLWVLVSMMANMVVSHYPSSSISLPSI
jgi:hypothetical protein